MKKLEKIKLDDLQVILNRAFREGNRGTAFSKKLVELAVEYDLSDALPKVVRPDKVSVFNAVTYYAVLAEMAKQHGDQDSTWTAIAAVLNEARSIGVTEGVKYCSLVRGWENNQGAAQGDQIIRKLSKDIYDTVTNPVKKQVLDILIAESDKGNGGLYAYPQKYIEDRNPNVKHAFEEHQKFVQNVRPFIGALKAAADLAYEYEEQNFLAWVFKEQKSETTDESVIVEGVKIAQESSRIKEELSSACGELTKALQACYAANPTSAFIKSEMYINCNTLAVNVRSIDQGVSDDMRYPLAKIALNNGVTSGVLSNFVATYEESHPGEVISLSFGAQGSSTMEAGLRAAFPGLTFTDSVAGNVVTLLANPGRLGEFVGAQINDAFGSSGQSNEVSGLGQPNTNFDDVGLD